MKVISNTSPLIGFAKIKQLPLLQQLFQRIMIPQMVYDEFFEACTSIEGQHFRAVSQDFIEIIHVEHLYPFSRRLDRGEQEVLTLAIEEQADLLLLDDRKAFNEAKELHIHVASTRTILTLAEERHLISSYQEIEGALRRQQFYLPRY
ncbi:hypothetical protein U27_00212 [Candidatus Vecturithrix granuli]|uniref:PIN domain-containing protein n=1 Tax=Vecturithrix granuli TaxID=1499967 RepID=A0A081C6W6_VECG1|nr:hypothetical protein U27_00212 [Candidatus Vecturithrix granuli]